MGVVFTIAVALAMAFVIFKVGYALLASFSSPMPEPPPPGELRRVKLRYRCLQCGMELRVTQAADQAIDPPRHCMDEMDLIRDDD
jgi:hypothetical protein